METYPIIKIPQKLKDIDSSMPALPSKPIEPKPPQKLSYLSKEPCYKEVKEPVLVTSDYGFYWYLLLGGIVFCYIYSILDIPDKFGILVVVSIAASIIGFAGLRSVSNENDKNKSKYIQAKFAHPKLVQEEKLKYQAELEEYKNILAKIEEAYRVQLELYKNVEYPIYLATLTSYDKNVDRIHHPEYVNKFRLNARKYFFSETTKPSVHPNIKDIKKGVSEDFFLECLVTIFGKSVFQNYYISENGLNRSYFPDFTIHDRNIGYCIDIEIDEPYIGCNGKPIHFVESLHDKTRDNFFIKNGWVVIRFTEKQIIESSADCCNVVVEVVNQICKGLVELELSKEAALIPIKQWSKDQAHEMAFNRVRNSYLKPDLIEKLSIEKHEIFEEYISALPKKEEIKLEPMNIPMNSKDYYDDLPF